MKYYGYLIIVLVALAPCAFWLWMIYLWISADRPEIDDDSHFFSRDGNSDYCSHNRNTIISRVGARKSLKLPQRLTQLHSGRVVEESGKFLGVRLGAYRSDTLRSA